MGSTFRRFMLVVASLFAIAPNVAVAADAGIEARLKGAEAALMTDPARTLENARSIKQALVALPQGKARTMAAARADWIAAAALVGLNRAKEAEPIFARALDGGIRRYAPDSRLVADLYMGRSAALIYLNQFEPALSGLRAAHAIYGRIGHPRGQALALENMGFVYALARDYKHALDYFRQSAETFGDDPALLLSIYYNRGDAFVQQGAPNEALPELARSLELARKLKSPLLEARVLGAVAQAQLLAGNLDAAERAITAGFALIQTNPSGDWGSMLYGTAAQLAFRRGDLNRAAALIERTFAGQTLATANVVMRPFVETGYRIFKLKGDGPRALHYLEAYKSLDDRARAIAASANAALLSARFDFANQQARIVRLRANEAVQQATIAQGRARIRAIILGGLLAAAFVVSALLFFGFVSIRRSRDRERAANEELHRTNDELEHALAARTEFLATTSHEIRTPLNGILGMTQVLLADRAIEPPVREKIQLVHGAGQTMKALVDDILDVAKMANGEIRIDKAPMDLRTLLRDAARVWEGQAETKGIRVVLDDDAPERIVEDEVRLRQIVFNLMSNAIKFTDRGEVRLTASAVAIDPDRPASGRRLQIAIRDTGIGIPADRLDEVFESFRQIDGGTTRRHGGTGLGLAICRNLARAMGGDVTVASVLGAGATFVVALPLEPVVQAAATAPRAGPPGQLAGIRLLLVEANPLSQSVLRAVLTPHVASFDVAASLAEAETAMADGRADLALGDVGTAGIDMARVAALVAAADRMGGRVALLWPSPDRTIEDAAAAQGVALLIAKPINAIELVARLKRLYVGDAPTAGIAA